MTKFKTFANIHVKISGHRTLNTSCEVIRAPDLRDCSEEEIVDGLRNQGVSKGKRITIQRK